MSQPTTRRFITRGLLTLLWVMLVACTGRPWPPAEPVRVTPAGTAAPARIALEVQTQPDQPAALAARQPGELAVYFLDVGQGDATLLAADDFNILIDAGRHERNDVVPQLAALGIETLDLLVGTHPHADHIGQFPAVLETFPVTEVWMSGNRHTTLTFEQALDAILASGAAYHEPRTGEVYQIGSARVEVVHPPALTGALNDDSLSLRILFGSVAFLFTGDAEAAGEAAMLAHPQDIRAHILHVGHHGSGTSSTLPFLQAVAPQVALYSAGRHNSYGHPHPDVVARFQELGILLYGTDEQGTVRVVSDGMTYRVETLTGERLWRPSAAPSLPTTTSAPAVASPAGACHPGQIDINTASREMLTELVHIGRTRAGRILALRPFTSLDELTRVRGIGPGRLADIKEQGLACVQ